MEDNIPFTRLMNLVEDTSPQLGGILDTNSKQIRWSKGSDVASANAITLGTDGNYFDITGTTTITSVSTLAIGTVVCLHFDGILILTYHATNLVLPTGANITTAAGDEAIFVEYDTGDWRCINYSRASGGSLILTAHKDTHDPENGSDPLDTAIPVMTGSINAKGSSHSFARADHVHETSILGDTTPQLGGDLEYNEKHQIFNRTLTSDNTASGDIITVTFGESVVFGQVCYPDATVNKYKLALATNVAVKHPGTGIVLETKGDGETGKLLLRGTIRDATYFSTATMADIVYLSDATPGSVLYAAPSDSGDIVQILGFGLENNYIFFNPDYTYVEIS